MKNNLIFLPTTLVQVATTDSFKSLEKWLLVYKKAIFFTENNVLQQSIYYNCHGVIKCKLVFYLSFRF